MKKKIKAANFIVCILLLAFLCGLTLLVRESSRWYSNNEMEILTTTKMKTFTAKEFINILKLKRILLMSYTERSTDTDIVQKDDIGVYVKGWPAQEDIPYLLSIVDDTTLCGITESAGSSFFPPRFKTYTDVGTVSLFLLKSIKEDKFYIYNGFPRIYAGSGRSQISG